ncbi:MAG: phosphatase PAP2 family protein [Chlorobiaceae bacterium]|nr:phosphatase PAP2 family protein [Chlorobiaceae bacterium]NTV61109.1 phosphatase PAP2 family protein [Chlorobiaceae bacterium]
MQPKLSVHRKIPVFLRIAFTLPLLLALLLNGSAEARAGRAGELISDDATGFYGDFGKVFSAPAHFDGNDWLTVAAIAGATATSVLFLDEPARDFARNRHTPFLDSVMPAGDYYGRLRTGYGIGSLIYLGGILAGADDVRLTGRAVIEAHTFALMITGVLKATAGRSRPFRDEGNMRFSMFTQDNASWSFPSGHAASSFAVSSALGSRIRRPWASAGLYALSALTCMQRIYDDRHWLSDTIVGAAIGTAVGLAVGHMINDEEEGMKRGSLVSQEPVPLIGVTFSF